jgi:Domain of unknown function (DUF4124)
MLSTVLGLACASALGGTVYKWVDEKGVTHYSDQPHPAAETVELKSAQTYSNGDAPAAATSSASASSANPDAAYATCELYRPENDEVFLNTDAVTAKLRLQPQLLPGNRVAIGLDGKRQTNQPTSGTDFTLTVERGTHTVVAVIEDEAGKELCRSGVVTFHVRQPSKQAPNRANRPRF